jgi:hypothetical protein
LDGIRLGGAKLADLSFGDQWELAELAAHVSRVIIHDLRTADR